MTEKVMEKTMRVQNLPVYMVRPNPYQPRKTFDKEALQELADSIAEHGVMQPITVRERGTYYEIVAGERRLRATKMAGLSSIPAIVVEMGDEESAYFALIENIQREDLTFMEEAEGYQALIKDYGVTQEKLALQLGKGQSTIANKLRLLKLSPQVKSIINEKGLTERHARALLRLPNESLQLKALARIVKDGLNVKKTEELIKLILESLNKEDKKKKSGQREIRYVKDIRLFTNTVKQAVGIMQKAGVPAKYETKQNEDKVEIVIEIPIK